MLCRAAAALTLKSKKCFDVYCILRYNEPCNYKNLITGNLRGGVEVLDALNPVFSRVSED